MPTTQQTHKTEPLGKYISIIHRYGHSFLEKRLGHLNISGGDLPYISVIHRNEGLNQDELSESLGVDKTTTARIVKKLINLDYVSRNHDVNDKRVYRLHLTPQAKAIIPQIKQATAEWNSAISRGLSEAEKAQSQEALRRMAENARRLKENNYQGLIY
jgi:DNA-binding MarR family transcriptional regulator